MSVLMVNNLSMKKMKQLPAALLTTLVLLFAGIIVYQLSLLEKQKKEMTMNRDRVNQTHEPHERLLIEVLDKRKSIHRFSLANPVKVSRDVLFSPEPKTANAFYLPTANAKTVEFEGQFIGDVNRGGSCNVDVLSYVPHGITHLETSAHVLSPDAHPPTVKDIPPDRLTGLVYLIDLTDLPEDTKTIPWQAVNEKLEKLEFSIRLLALKTRGSQLPQDYDYSGKDFLALSEQTAKGIHDFGIQCLLLDLPSIDPEKDEGKLLAHRAFFGLPSTGIEANDREKRALVELAWFDGLEEGYYYSYITPPSFQANAVTTGIIFHPLISVDR